MATGIKHTMVVTFIESDENDTTFSSFEEGISQGGGHVESDVEVEVEIDEWGYEVEDDTPCFDTPGTHAKGCYLTRP